MALFILLWSMVWDSWVKYSISILWSFCELQLTQCHLRMNEPWMHTRDEVFVVPWSTCGKYVPYEWNSSPCFISLTLIFCLCFLMSRSFLGRLGGDWSQRYNFMCIPAWICICAYTCTHLLNDIYICVLSCLHFYASICLCILFIYTAPSWWPWRR